jgi:hypothetical protein
MTREVGKGLRMVTVLLPRLRPDVVGGRTLRVDPQGIRSETAYHFERQTAPRPKLMTSADGSGPRQQI